MKTQITPFQDRLLPAQREKGFRQDAYWVWCGSVVEGEDGRFHMFAARWPKAYPFFLGYQAASEVVRASSSDPAGPYRFEEVLFEDRGSSFWDGRMTHNPFIVRYGHEYLLFYIGTTYQGQRPAPEEVHRLWSQPHTARDFPWYRSIRIGMARSPSVFGPWKRPDSPTFDIDPNGWDNTLVTNPAPCVTPDGRILLYYRSAGKIGLAAAQSPEHPFLRQLASPVLNIGDGLAVEDPFVFWSDDHFEMLCKDITGRITGELHAGTHLLSPDGISWRLAKQPKAWSRTILWEDGSESTLASFERPFILFRDGRPAFLFAAVADGSGPKAGLSGYSLANNTWNLSIALKSGLDA